MSAPVRTTCPYCGVGCGVLARPDGVVGDPDHPANAGRLCSKGSALAETIGPEGRLLAPRIGGRESDWDTATTLVARKFSEAIAEHGPDSVAFYVSGQLLTEDYYVANKLMKGFIGSANIDTNSRLCMASAVAGHKRAFGADIVPGCYDDLEEADLVVLVGSNLAWCHPVLYQRLAAAKAARPGMRVVVLDPRRTATCDLADEHLALAPGSDVALFNGLLRWIGNTGAGDAPFIAAHVAGAAAAFAAARRYPVLEVSRMTGLTPQAVARFYAGWLETTRVVTLFSQGVNQSIAGTDKVNAIINCHLATGRIGKPGMGPFSVTGQPNAMGGREVGGLATMLANHLDLGNAGHRAAVQAHWQSPVIADKPGLKAVELFDACADGRIKALWIMSTNPAVSLPRADAVADAIRACPFVVVSDIMAETDTTALADVLLPAAGWGEKSGTVTNSERVISRQRAFLPAPGQARPDWRIVSDVARAMGFAGFEYDGPAAIFREYAALSGVAAGLGACLDIGGLAGLTDAQYGALAPLRWGPARFFGAGGFPTGDERARMVPISHRPPACAASAHYPLMLNTGRVRDHWHTMTRTAKSARLSRHIAEPFAEIHPQDAERLGIAPATLVHVESPHGAVVVRALVTARVAPGAVFVPMHWTAQWAAAGRVGALMAGDVDPVSGQPELKATPVSVRPFAAAWHGFAVSRAPLRPDAPYWARARTPGGWQAEFALDDTPGDWLAFAHALIGDGEPVSVFGPRLARVAILREGRLRGALFAAPGPVAVARGHAVAALAENDAHALLAARPGAAQPDPGTIVCACFDVGVNTIRAAIAGQGLTDVAAIGAALNAGTGCGSCRPELQTLIDRAALKVAAE